MYLFTWMPPRVGSAIQKALEPTASQTGQLMADGPGWRTFIQGANTKAVIRGAPRHGDSFSIRFRNRHLTNNSLEDIPASVVGSMRNGSQVLLAANPLHCGCNARPLKYFMLQQTVPSEDLQSIYCGTPALIKDKQLISLEDEYLHCDEEERERYKGFDYEQLTDVRFREVKT